MKKNGSVPFVGDLSNQQDGWRKKVHGTSFNESAVHRPSHKVFKNPPKTLQGARVGQTNSAPCKVRLQIK